MSTLETAENIVSKLNTSELIEFRKWFAEYHGTVWDEQIEADAAAGNSTRLPKRPSPNTEQNKAREI